MRKITPSKLALAKACTFWARPDVEWNNTTSAAAARGTLIHDMIARYIVQSQREAVPEDIQFEYDRACGIVDALKLEGWRLQPEVPFAWDFTTDEARRLRGHERDYTDATELEVPGTADVVGLKDDVDDVLIVEWKSGSAENSHSQLEALALFAGRTFGAKDVHVMGVSLSSRFDDHVDRCTVEKTFTQWDLSLIAADLRDLFVAEYTKPQPGEHCSSLYCPAKQSCPVVSEALATVAKVETVAAAPAPDAFNLCGPIESADHAAWLLARVRLIAEWCDERKDAIKVLCPPDGWKLSDGRTLKETRSTSSRFDQDRAVVLLKELGATTNQVESLTYKYERSNGLRVYGGKK